MVTTDSSFNDPSDTLNPTTNPSLAKLWGKKYIKNLLFYSQAVTFPEQGQLVELTSLEGRTQTAHKLLQSLNFASSQAWSKAEALLAQEVQRHGIDPQHINPWLIAQEAHELFQKVLTCYQESKPPENLAIAIGADCGRVRKAVTAQDPRIIGFVSMQVHYTGQMLLEPLLPTERILIADYFKVLDDHLYMPLQRAYEAAAQHDFYSPDLSAVQALLPQSSKLAQDICLNVSQNYSAYRSYSGLLGDQQILISSTRDIEMFQIYLCVCVLERNITAFQDELFPLCTMLYPPLHVDWWLVRLLVDSLEHSIDEHLSPLSATRFRPYITAMQDLFAADVVGA